MKKRALTISACIIFLFFASIVFAQKGSLITVDEVQICISVAEMEPVGAGQRFSEDIYRLYCFMS